MATVTDLESAQLRSADLDELCSILLSLVGKPFLFFRAGYDDELTLHLGAPVAYRSPRMKSIKKGSYLLGSRTSAWLLNPGTPPSRVLSSETVDDISLASRTKRLELSEIEGLTTIDPGSIVTAAFPHASPSGLVLSLEFSDGSTLVLLPSDDGMAEDEEPLAHWEIFMPGHKLLRAGPGDTWSYLDSRTKPSQSAPG